MPKKRAISGQYIKGTRVWESLLEYECVEKWLRRYSKNARDMYGRALLGFTEKTELTPDQLLEIEDLIKLRDLIMDYCLEIAEAGKGALANHTRAALKSFFVFHDKQPIPFRPKIDTIHFSPKKLQVQKIPSLEEVYRIADLTNNPRDRAIILCLAQSGVRVSCLCRWTWSMIKDQLYPQVQAPVKLLITPELDNKILKYSRNFYYTFLAEEAAEALKAWLDYRMSKGWKPKELDPLWVAFERDNKTPTVNPIERRHVWEMVNRITKKARLDGVWVHLLRKTFDNTLVTSIPFAYKAALLGHNLPGSAGAYFDWNNVEELEKQYQSADWSRSGLSRINHLEKTVAEQEEVIRAFQREIATLHAFRQEYAKFQEEIAEFRKEAERFKEVFREAEELRKNAKEFKKLIKP